MTEIVIQGIGGRMGHVLCDMIAQREDCRVIAGIDIKDGEQNGIPVYDSLEKLEALLPWNVALEPISKKVAQYR